MTRFLLAGGLLAAMMGAAVLPPVLVARLESGALTVVGVGVIAVGSSLIVCGLTAVVVGFRLKPVAMPSGVRAAVAATVLFLAFFAMEFSDGLVRQGGRILYWTTMLVLPALLLFYGLLAARRWAWWTFRGVAALGALWFLGFAAVIPFASLHANGVRVPWSGRFYMICVSLGFAAILASAYWSLGRSETQRYFRVEPTDASAP